MKRIGLLRNQPCYDGNYMHTISSLGLNTGNLAFWSAIEKLLGTERVEYSVISDSLNEKFDKIIITDLIWIREGDCYNNIRHLLDVFNNDIIPISVGLQSHIFNPNFHISAETTNILKRIEERNIIGVRGEYTASILKKHGIKNIEVIGCPSMYYMNDENFRINENFCKEIKFASNFKTFFSKLTSKEKHFLSYCATNKSFFVEQTQNEFTLEQANYDAKYFNYINDWLRDYAHIYYNIEDWNRCISRNNFCIGARFHGNVIALRNNIKALFLICDSRTTELTEFFNLPSINIENFDCSKDIRYYYEIADYTDFNKTYKDKFQKFKNFLSKNGIDLRS